MHRFLLHTCYTLNTTPHSLQCYRILLHKQYILYLPELYRLWIVWFQQDRSNRLCIPYSLSRCTQWTDRWILLRKQQHRLNKWLHLLQCYTWILLHKKRILYLLRLYRLWIAWFQQDRPNRCCRPYSLSRCRPWTDRCCQLYKLLHRLNKWLHLLQCYKWNLLHKQCTLYSLWLYRL